MSMQYYYMILEKTPVGRVLMIGSENGIASISLSIKKRDIPNRLLLYRLISGVEPQNEEGSIGGAVNQLKEYFSGKRTDLNFKLDFSAATEFRRKVFGALVNVKAGQTISYGELARAAGSPNASRAVGSAMAENPLPLAVPCHRVVRSDGRLGGFRGGLDMKRKLLRLEGVNI